MGATLRRILGTLGFIVAIGLSTQAFAQQHQCLTPFDTVLSTVEGVCPFVVDGGATCTTVAGLANLVSPVQLGPTNVPKGQAPPATVVDGGDTFSVTISLL